MEQICVAVRVRPLIKQDALKGNLWKVGPNSVTLYSSLGTPVSGQSYNFDHVFGTNSRNADIYDGLTKDVIVSAVNGFNGTVFAYGQTSSGKTYTMKGSELDPGIIGLAVRDVFKIIETMSSREFLIRVSYMEIYNEEINDLLVSDNRKLQIHENLEKGIFVAGLREEIVDSPDQVLGLLQFGDAHRHFGETNMNLYSSRSHTIFRMVIESRDKTPDIQESDATSDAVRVSALNMVDLAGSERVSKTGAGGARLKEGTHINKSLMTLGTVINKLSDGGGRQGGHIPYRDSKLTRILQPALGGNARTAMICTITPDEVHIDETRGTLQFASRAKRVTNCAQVNEILTDAALLKRQTKEIEDLRMKLQGLPPSEQLEKEILTLRNELLKGELDRERLFLELQEEKKKAHAERERHVKEQEQKRIESLSSLMMSSALEDHDKLTKRNNRRETWCPRQVTPEIRKQAFQKLPSQDLEDDFIHHKLSLMKRERNVMLPPAFETLLDEEPEVSWVLSSGFEEGSPPSDFENIADEDTWMSLNKGHQGSVFTPINNFEYRRSSAGSTAANRISFLECELRDLQSKYDTLSLSYSAQCEEVKELRQEVQETKNQMNEVQVQKQDLELELGSQQSLQKQLEMDLGVLENFFGGAKLVTSSLLEILADTLQHQGQVLAVLQGCLINDDGAQSLNRLINLKIKTGNVAEPVIQQVHDRSGETSFCHELKHDRLQEILHSNKGRVIQIQNRDCLEHFQDCCQSSETLDSTINQFPEGFCRDSTPANQAISLGRFFPSSYFATPLLCCGKQSQAVNGSEPLMMGLIPQSSMWSEAGENNQTARGQNLELNSFKNHEQAVLCVELPRPALSTSDLPLMTGAEPWYRTSCKLPLHRINCEGFEENMAEDFQIGVPWPNGSCQCMQLLSLKLEEACESGCTIYQRGQSEELLQVDLYKKHWETPGLMVNMIEHPHLQPAADEVLREESKLLLCRNDDNHNTDQGQNYSWRNVNQHWLVHQLLIKIQAVRSLEANLASAELEVVELKVEIEEMRAKMHMCSCFTNSLGSSMELELLYLRDQCAKYQENMKFALDALRDNMARERELQKLLHENNFLKRSLTKAKQRTLCTKVSQQDQRKLSATEKPMAVASTEVEGSCTAISSINLDFPATNSGGSNDHVNDGMWEPIRPALETLDVNGKNADRRTLERGVKRRRKHLNSTDAYLNKENL